MTNNLNNKLNNIATRVINKIPNDDKTDNFTFVITTLMIISIILTLVRVIQECDKSKVSKFTETEKYSYYGTQIKSKTIRRSWFTKMTIKKILRKELSQENYKTYGVALMNAILDTGETLTDDDIITLVEAANV